MERKSYRVETTNPKGRNPQHFLVKNIRVGDSTAKVKKYIGSGKEMPSAEEIDSLRINYAYNIELKAAQAAGKIGVKEYHTEYLSPEQVNVLEQIRYLNNVFRETMTRAELEAYEEQFEISYVSGTTSIEGNTLTINQAIDLYKNGIVPAGKTIREVYEIENFKSVKKYREQYKGSLSIDLIRSLHALIMKNIDDESAGIFRRTDDIIIGGCDIRPTPAELIEPELLERIEYYHSRIKEGYHPFEEAIMMHYFFEIIHPFADGNGRVGREMLNFLLSKNRYPRLLFPGKSRHEYLLALKHGDDEHYKKMVSAFTDLIVDQYYTALQENLKKLLSSMEGISKVHIRFKE